jgi:hypothetical protein
MEFLRRNGFLRPTAKAFQVKRRALAQHDSGSDALTPLGVRDTDDRAFRNGRVLAKLLFNLQSRHLVAAGLENESALELLSYLDHCQINRSSAGWKRD